MPDPRDPIRRNRRPVPNRKGFTLIEVLVVVAIIALLVSILMPSLARAREQARSAVCAANLKHIGQGGAEYQTTNRGWIAGSPLTTGHFLTKTQAWNPATPGFTRIALDWMDFSTPLQAQMLGINAIPDPRKGDPTETRKQIYRKVTDGLFHCPSNEQTARPFGSGSAGFPVIRAPSYLSMWTLMRGGQSLYDRAPQLFPGVTPGHIAQSSGWELAVPTDYLPHVDRLGRPVLKVFVADGLRFYDNPNDPIDYTIDPAGAKGMMGAEPPSTYVENNDAFDREYVTAKQYSYRHGQKKRINAAFFDGHAEALFATTEKAGPFTGSAVHPKLYYPSGTIVKQPADRLHLNIPPDTVLP